jgi:hypothetical protein
MLQFAIILMGINGNNFDGDPINNIPAAVFKQWRVYYLLCTTIFLQALVCPTGKNRLLLIVLIYAN